ncbi:hypothetical protein FGLOB1_2683 [Fusarium globosum]|uniref:Uncharacterized protein n=1 Tax=Fusarium globosum TaxID=78864 RepID=A0A8H5YRV5_9HYPO|nr:hypothetical protein FGLOB1_2683 [Fusarium globosum]
MEPIEDLIDLSCEPSEQATLMPPFIRPQSIDLLGLQFIPIASDEEVASPSSLDVGQATEPINTRWTTGYLRESSLPPEVHPAVAEASRIVLASDMVSDELLDGSPMGSSQAPNIGEFGLQKGLADLEPKHGHAQRQRASARGSAEISDKMRKGSVTTKVPGKNVNDSRYQFHDSVYIPDDETRPNTARRPRPRAKQSDRSKSTDSTEVNPGTPPDEKGPMLLKTRESSARTPFHWSRSLSLHELLLRQIKKSKRRNLKCKQNVHYIAKQD